MNEQIRQLSQQLRDLEQRLGDVSASYAEISHALSPFMARYYTELMPYQEKLVEVMREIADRQVMLGDYSAAGEGQPVTPLSDLLDETNLSVEEQYKRYGLGFRPANKFDPPRLPEPSDQLVQMYSQLVPKIHPWLAKTESEKARRQDLYKRANFAYVKRDERALRTMVDSHAKKPTSLPAVVDPNRVNELEERIFDLEELIYVIEGQIFEMRHGDIAKLKGYEDQAREQGKNLFKQLQNALKRMLRDKLQLRDKLRKQTNSE